ncbi:MAG: insulinase family protein [Myxococcales bacterium]|nr:insulinase family protein [Myxococcales bacterium]
MSDRFTTSAGSLVLTEHNRALPVVGLGLSLRAGALLDPEGKEGMTRLFARALRMGPRGTRSLSFEQSLERIGAQLSLSVSQSYAHIGALVVAKNFEPLLELLSALLTQPAFRAADVAQVRREAIADLIASTDDDRSLCVRNFRSRALGDHPYARSRVGTLASLRRVGQSDLIEHHARVVAGKNLVIGVWGDYDPDALPGQLDAAFGALPRGKNLRPKLKHPKLRRGRHLCIVDKPERSQTQILVGTLGTHPSDPEHTPLLVGNTAFGGLFTSRLTHEVRAKRGWSYGASSGLTHSLTRDLWSMHTYPAASDARACLELQLELFERWVEDGISERELKAAKGYLIKSHPFEVDTASKRLDRKLDIELFNWPADHHTGMVEAVGAVGCPDIARALSRRLSARDLMITVVATASELQPQLESLPGIESVQVVPFDRV